MPKTTGFKKLVKVERPYCFLSYSSRESHVPGLFPCLWIAFGKHYDLKLTPSALESGSSQHEQIVKLIKGASFGVVVLDGLRPNVVWEYGCLAANGIPVILLKEKAATVDIKGYLGDTASTTPAPPIEINSHFSNVKDVNYALWDRLHPGDTIKMLLAEYKKKKNKIKNYIEVSDSDLWYT
jgi:hypothetical protein